MHLIKRVLHSVFVCSTGTKSLHTHTHSHEQTHKHMCTNTPSFPPASRDLVELQSVHNNVLRGKA